ncbi:MAG: hypothetical protein JWN04_3644, partial [Myxococcaceae bacterium]|nr:hypothetical protein [Myxococcaceae bacterium]
ATRECGKQRREHGSYESFVRLHRARL